MTLSPGAQRYAERLIEVIDEALEDSVPPCGIDEVNWLRVCGVDESHEADFEALWSCGCSYFYCAKALEYFPKGGACEKPEHGFKKCRIVALVPVR
jgi:hypothetical protein